MSHLSLSKKCPYSELFWSERWKIRTITDTLYAVPTFVGLNHDLDENKMFEITLLGRKLQLSRFHHPFCINPLVPDST